jgi:hypothetical protein
MVHAFGAHAEKAEIPYADFRNEVLARLAKTFGGDLTCMNSLRGAVGYLLRQ